MFNMALCPKGLVPTLLSHGIFRFSDSKRGCRAEKAVQQRKYAIPTIVSDD